MLTNGGVWQSPVKAINHFPFWLQLLLMRIPFLSASSNESSRYYKICFFLRCSQDSDNKCVRFIVHNPCVILSSTLDFVITRRTRNKRLKPQTLLTCDCFFRDCLNLIDYRRQMVTRRVWSPFKTKQPSENPQVSHIVAVLSLSAL